MRAAENSLRVPREATPRPLTRLARVKGPTSRTGILPASGALESMWVLPVSRHRTQEEGDMAARTISATREIEGRDSVGLYLDEIARTPLLDAATEVELSKTIEAGLLRRAPARRGPRRPQEGRRPDDAPPRRSSSGSPRRAARPSTAVHQRQPAAGRLDRPQVRPRPDADARPDPGGQHRPDPRGREVRLRQGLQVLDVRHLVGAPGDHPRHRAAGPRRTAPRARRRGAQPGRRRPPHPRAPARPRPGARGDRRRARHGRSSGSST